MSLISLFTAVCVFSFTMGYCLKGRAMNWNDILQLLFKNIQKKKCWDIVMYGHF